jgi:glycerol-3-phosphate dehydrogenase
VRLSKLSFEEQQNQTQKDRAFGNIVCRCNHISEAEIRTSIRRTNGAQTLDGVKRRAGALMGRCQGTFCTQKIIEILAEERDKPISEIRKDSHNSTLISDDHENL